MASEQGLVRLWKTKHIPEVLKSYLAKKDLTACRLVSRELAVYIAPILFADIEVRFRSSTFNRPSRMAALERIGGHIQAMTFKISHDRETFLPPILDPIMGTEQTFIYTPQRRQHSGSRQMTELLVKQYPPLFHASTNIPSFVQALTMMSGLQHLLCIDLIANGNPASTIERSPHLSLLSVHPGAVLYLCPALGFGASPASCKRWSQTCKLTVQMTNFGHEPGQPTDHLKLLHAYLASFPSLRRLVFHWEGERGLSPLSLATKPSLNSKATGKPSQACPQRCASLLRPLKFKHLQQMELVNATMDASQVASFIQEHRSSLREFNFGNVVLRGGNWDDALAPLTRLRGSEGWKQGQRDTDTVDVPIVLTPAGVSQKQLYKAICALQQQKGPRRVRSLAKARSRTRELLL
ncbi:hypothetical protein DTO013E5_6296 [Penicillium roqueforti]|nr:hypothetical protein CBS147337_8107 [Penicillium roqueforti]KAI2674108.1 hypothetical protein CBS147355_7283 [Penicillium roqueforti]KAI2714116.1 hypothetical protein CBS147318_6857 [Penicillium roqueforti]KAI2715822.1 hypothetical protein CBS147354_7205 [Penicillium roqueforti]KAI2739302.1 hypothetical protein DTO012A1_6130 [Penicillium roqueforti]